MGANEWDVRVDGCTVVVELPRQLALDERSGKRLSEALTDAVRRPHVDFVLALVDVEHPLSDGLYDVVHETARRAAANDVRAWHVVAEHDIKGTALAQAIPRLETAVFADERAARKQHA